MLQMQDLSGTFALRASRLYNTHWHRLLAVGLGLADTPKANHGSVHLNCHVLFLSNAVIR